MAALEQADLMRVAWHLCEIFYWSIPLSEASSTVPAPLITDWARASLDPFSVDDPLLDPSSLEYFWNYIQRLLLRGEIPQAVSLLASMPTSSDAIIVSALLQRMPIQTMGIHFSLLYTNNSRILQVVLVQNNSSPSTHSGLPSAKVDKGNLLLFSPRHVVFIKYFI